MGFGFRFDRQKRADGQREAEPVRPATLAAIESYRSRGWLPTRPPSVKRVETQRGQIALPWGKL